MIQKPKSKYLINICTSIVITCYFQSLLILQISILKDNTMLGSSLPPVVCRGAHALFTFSVFVCVQWCPTQQYVVFFVCFVGLRLVSCSQWFLTHALCCVLVLVYFVLCIICCQFLIAPSVFANVYQLHVFVYMYACPLRLFLLL